MSCDQCQFLFLNGIGCHEIGCPNANQFKCSCGEYSKHKHYANDWDGIALCKDCAERQAEYEAELEFEQRELE